MFVGKVLQRWLHDEQGSVQAVTFDFLKDNITNIDDAYYGLWNVKTNIFIIKENFFVIFVFS